MNISSNKNNIRNLLAVIASLVIAIPGESLSNTLTTLELGQEHIPHFMVGLASSSFYAGLTIGAFIIEPFIVRVGHIRAFSTFASLMSALYLCQGFYLNEWLWLVIRFFIGYCTSGIFIVIESWLLASSDRSNRGVILSVYMIATYLAQAVGQLFLTLKISQSIFLFCISSLLASVSVLPLAMSKVTHPQIEKPSTLSLKKLWEASGSGILACIIGGVMQGGLGLLTPAFMSDLGFSMEEIAYNMFFLIIGGMALQYPVGLLSDKFNRHYVLAIVTFLSAVISLITIYAAFNNQLIFTISIFLLGGLTFSIYPIGISMACDMIEYKDIVKATQGLLLSYGVGATVGPISTPIFNTIFGKSGLFIYFSLILFMLCAFILVRIFAVTDKNPLHKDKAIPLQPTTTPVSSEFDPRAEEPEESAKEVEEQQT
jgi:MFS family permease